VLAQRRDVMRRLAVVIAAATLLSACVTAPPPAEADPNGELVILGAEPTPQHLDPQQAAFVSEVSEVALLFDTLLTYDRSGTKLVPASASELPQRSSDGLTYTIGLRTGLEYSDGRPLTAADFVFAFRHLCDPTTRSQFAGSAFAIAGCEKYHADDPAKTAPADLAADRAALGVIATDDHTLTFTLAAPASYFPFILASWFTAPTREDAVAKGDRWTEPATFVGNGLFRMVSWSHRVQMVLERNDRHRPVAKLKRIVLDLAFQSSAALAAYREGGLDALGLGIDQKAGVEADPVLSKQLQTAQSACTSFYGFNVRRPPFDDPLVRLAFAKSFDRATYTTDLLRGAARPTLTFIPPGLPGYDPDDSAQAFDPPAARGLLARSRYAGALPAVRLTFSPSALGTPILRAVADGWQRNLGVDVQLDPIDGTTALELQRRPETVPQLAGYAWCADYPDPQNFLQTVFTSTTTTGHTNYSSPAYDDLIRRAEAQIDPAVRLSLYKDAQRLLTADAPAIFVSVATSAFLIAPRVHGTHFTPLDHAFSQFTLSEVYVERRPAPK
jgi:oligopeptide transport system substrate-binding protein